MKVYAVYRRDNNLFSPCRVAFFLREEEASEYASKVGEEVIGYEIADPKIEDLLIVKKFREFVAGLECTKHKVFLERLNHAVMGVGTEAGELLSEYKEQFIYPENGELVLESWEDETCDLLHYFIMLTNILGISIDKLIALNMAKLKARYPGGYNEGRALNKDREKEKKAMEGVKDD